MSFLFNPATKACLRKEWQAEFRNPQGLYLSSLFGLMAMASIMFIKGQQRPTAELAGGLFSLVVLFSALTAVPRLFISEEDQGTFDLARQWGSLDSLWLGKALFAALTQGVSALVLGIIYSGVIGIGVVNPIHYWLGVGMIGIGAANVLSLTSALVVTARNRWMLATVIAIPLLFPFLFVGIGALRVGLGTGTIGGGWQSLLALFMYGVAPLAVGPILAATLWNERKDPPLKLTHSHNEEAQ